MQLPVIDISGFINDAPRRQVTANEIHDACIDTGFFYISGHGIEEDLIRDLDKASREFFALELEEKMRIRMALAGKAWRGYFPVGDELTSGKPDLKEGLYFGQELPDDDLRVKAGTPMHGSNMFPERPGALQRIVLEYIDRMTDLGQVLMRGVSASLNLSEDFIYERYTRDPFVLFRIFHYPYQESNQVDQWGVGEHTDYGLLTILNQDSSGGLQVRAKGGWIDAPPIPGTFVCNIGDMLERLTRGYYQSTPHRVLNTSGRGRLSFPFFFDPSFDAELHPLPVSLSRSEADGAHQRWDGQSVHREIGTYGEYILEKVGKVFPGL